MSTVRLAHFSDIHVTASPLGWRLRDLLTKRTSGWLNGKLRRNHHFRDASKIVVAMMADIRSRSVDHLVFSGDATGLGFETEHRAAAGVLDLTLPGLAVPGNHDYYTRSAVRAGAFERVFAHWQQGERTDQHTYPFAQRVGHVWLIGVNSARSNFLLWDARGGVEQDEMNRLRDLLRQLSPGPRILVTHYPLYLAGGEPEHRWRLLRGWQAFLRVAADNGIALWLHGHRHSGYVLPASGERPFPIICAGSATQLGRASWNDCTITGTRLSMVKRAWDAPTSQFVDASTIELDLPHGE